MHKMNWPYVAGFFDGEGNITICPNGARRAAQYSAHFCQTGDEGLLLLGEIRQFLSEQGVLAHLSQQSDRAQRAGIGHRKMYGLRVSGRKHLAHFLKQIFPYLRIKKTKAQDTLRYLTLFPDAQGLHFRFHNPANKMRVNIDRDAVKQDRDNGMSYMALAIKYGTCHTTIARIILGTRKSRREQLESQTIQ